MKKIVALMRKEYLETRHISLCILIAGVLFPWWEYWIGLYSFYPTPIESLRLHLPGNFVVLALVNLAILCAVAFSREREKGTETILRRVNPDWHIAAATKFAYAFISALSLALFFGLFSVGFDWYARAPIGSAIMSFYRSWDARSPDAHVFTFVVFAACWGIFWTGRLRRRIISVFFAFFTPIILLIGANWACKRLYLDYFVSTTTLNLYASFLALAFAPFPQRFGYRQR